MKKDKAYWLVDFIQKSTKKHNGLYNYSKVQEFENNDSKVIILCPKHGEFEQRVRNHLSNHGCKGCHTDNMTIKNSKHKSYFIEQCIYIHGEKYDYSLLEEFPGVNKKSKIICSTHGVFEKSLSNHIRLKQGCPMCTAKGRYTEHFFNLYPEQRYVKSKLYIIGLMSKYDSETFFKVGITKYDTNIRWKKLEHYDYYELLSFTGPLYDIFKYEQYILKEYTYKHRFTPKYRFGGDRECFNFDTLGTVLNSIDSDLLKFPTVQICQ